MTSDTKIRGSAGWPCGTGGGRYQRANTFLAGKQGLTLVDFPARHKTFCGIGGV